MSGGVDSSVAAGLLKNQGYEPTGIFLHFWKEDIEGESSENKCCSISSLMDARRVCQRMGIPLYTFNFSQPFKKKIVDDFLHEYKIGHTPNPCVRCNKYVKLGMLIERAKKLGYGHVASGHYARIKKTDLAGGRAKNQKGKKTKIIYKLYRAKDKDKDQSYFLYTFTQDELKHLLFPLGDYAKPQVRALAKKYKFSVAEKKESQEICFVSGKSHNDFLKRHLKLKKGPIKLLSNSLSSPLLIRTGNKGEVVGEHGGLPLYTIGQRKGVEIGGIGPFYVAKTDHKTNTLYVVADGNNPILFRDHLWAKNINWISGKTPKMPFSCAAVIRYRHKPVKCQIKKENNQYYIKFIEPQRAVTPGQSIVFYKGEEVLGGGIIVR